MAERTWKLQNYLAVPTLEEYILVDAKSLKMELYRREQNKWVYYMFGPDDELELSSVGLRFPVAEAYVNVDLENESSPEEE
jgi:Uma2 family endonuclease